MSSLRRRQSWRHERWVPCARPQRRHHLARCEEKRYVHGSTTRLAQHAALPRPCVLKCGSLSVLAVISGLTSGDFLLLPVLNGGPVAPAAGRAARVGLIKQFLKDVEWGELEYLVIDTPPGTSDEHISLAQFLTASGGVDGAVIVTTPQEVALADVRKEIGFCNKVSPEVCPAAMREAAARCASVGAGGHAKPMHIRQL